MEETEGMSSNAIEAIIVVLVFVSLIGAGCFFLYRQFRKLNENYHERLEYALGGPEAVVKWKTEKADMSEGARNVLEV